MSDVPDDFEMPKLPPRPSKPKRMCPVCGREFVGFKVLDYNGLMELREYVCMATGFECPFVSMQIWEDFEN